MNCTIIYGESASIKHTKTLPVAEAFTFKDTHKGYAFYDIYFNDRLVSTTQGLAGYAYVCEDCPYAKGGN